MRTEKWVHGNRDALFELCRKYTEKARSDAQPRREPYLPYVPEDWNGILVLAEAKNMNEKRYPEDVHTLKSCSAERYYENLYWHGEAPQIGPWQKDKPVQFALKALNPEIDLEAVAVSNAVLWAFVKENGSNMSPPPQDAVDTSVEFWADFFNICRKPQKIVTIGKTAREVMEKVEEKGACAVPRLALIFPGGRTFGTALNAFDRRDLILRYPEIARAAKDLGKDIDQISREDVFYAAHAASMGRTFFPR